MTLLSAAPADAGAEVPRTPARVPWSTVLPLALVLAYADGFWVTTLRSAVGAISRTQNPFTSYLRTSALALPVFVFAVLAALTFARSRFGHELRSRKALLGTGLLVALAVTVAAVVMAASSATYDYHLQSDQLSMMAAMGHDCNAVCVSGQRWMTISAHIRAVGYTSVALLLTNVVVLGWAVAMRGGRLRVSDHRPPAAANPDRPAASRARDLRLLTVVGVVTCAAVHAVVVPAHLQEWWAAGVFFTLLTVAEIAVAAALARPGRAALVATTVVSAVPLGVWVVSRTVGLPFGPEAGTAEAVGVADTVSCLLEVGTLIAALLLLRRADRAARPPLSASLWALAVLAVVAFGTFGIAGAAPSWFDGIPSSPHDATVAEVHPRH